MGKDITARTAVWKGLNRTPYIEDGEMRSMKNLSSDAFPYLTTRKGREEYMMDVYVPGVPGDGYWKDVTKNPDADEEYVGEIIKNIGVTPDRYTSGEFYHYDGENWISGINNDDFYGIVNSTTGFKTKTFSNNYYAYSDENYKNKYGDKIIKYMGESKKFEYSDKTFEMTKGGTYIYKIEITAYWKETDNVSRLKKYGEITSASEVPEPTEKLANEKKYFKYTGEDSVEYNEELTLKSKKTYKCVLKGHGYWEEYKTEIYEPVKKMPENAEEGKVVRYFGDYAGDGIEKTYYTCIEEYYNKKPLYFYLKNEKYDGDFETGGEKLYEESAENVGKTYYAGTEKDTFYICEQTEEVYKWNPTEQPLVLKKKTFEEYLTEYHNGLNKIIEIGKFNGKVAVLFEDKDGKVRLYYEKQLFDEIYNLSENSGKKLQNAGNKLIVGESGCYLHYEKERDEDGNVTSSTLKMHSAAESFSRTIKAYDMQRSETEYRESYITAYKSGSLELRFLAPTDKNEGYREVYEGLSTEGTMFKIKIDETWYYLKLKSATYTEKKMIGSDSFRNYYATELKISADGMTEEIEWNSESGNKEFTIASIAPHYCDVVAWKKRLWGYDDNYVQGSIQDIFNENGQVDWITGNNTYTEAISQPLWQGGNITGLAALRDALVVFKEDNLTMITGNYPAIMQGSTIICRGLPVENRESVAVANESVYYLSEDGVYRFGGGVPYCISEKAKISGTDAIGASDGRKYWLSLKDDDENNALYVYDIGTGMWHKEDDVKAVSFVLIGSKMYMATQKQIFCIDAPQENVEWEAELWYDEGTYNYKKYKGFEVRGNLGECEVYLKADDGDWVLYTFTENKLSLKTEPFWCRELGIKFKGKGICEIKSLDRIFEITEN